MNLALLITAAPNRENAWHALKFCEAALAAGHAVSRVFFYGDGVHHASTLLTPPQDEPNLHHAWAKLAQAHELELIVCVAAALRRGVLDADNARRMEQATHNVGTPYTISGLGQLVESMLEADRFVTFAG